MTHGDTEIIVHEPTNESLMYLVWCTRCVPILDTSEPLPACNCAQRDRLIKGLVDRWATDKPPLRNR
jgi:hypothetical protein